MSEVIMVALFDVTVEEVTMVKIWDLFISGVIRNLVEALGMVGTYLGERFESHLGKWTK